MKRAREGEEDGDKKEEEAKEEEEEALPLDPDLLELTRRNGRAVRSLHLL